MSRLHACPSCARHVRSTEPTCPFCDAALPERSLVRERARANVASRAALVFAATSAVAACAGGGGPVATYGPPPIDTHAAEAADAGKDGAK